MKKSIIFNSIQEKKEFTKLTNTKLQDIMQYSCALVDIKDRVEIELSKTIFDDDIISIKEFGEQINGLKIVFGRNLNTEEDSE